ncbi:transglycosylase SLT domain-containing protein [Methylomonas sp. SURF-2]|uniref:Transglycosylase SLT domain-containing protein n=1 Tax=Methylomonas subterranea TaxID=2952225 RepID=A0ABT1TI43_9GAMM|nr:transglycosylase SLT domain-containing protein [Methylomonas sp. SURF-2]MCQ8105132.1 transglycosylase SLT domain-containing protein [Methylomonas sp. SURF-2]
MSRMKRPLVICLLSILVRNGWAIEIPDSPESMRVLAASYEHGRDGVKQDYLQAFELYCRAALKGDTESAYNMGFMYFNGRGKPRDLGLAVRWFKQAADAGDAHAKNMLARYSDLTPAEDAACKPAEPELKLVADPNPTKGVVAEWVNQIAPVYGIDPDLVMAVIRAESGFNTSAVSNKNAQGLMQLIPETAARFGVADSWDPIQNIKGGTAYLHWLMRHFDGKVDLVLAAYNAGEGAVERYHGIPPYRETQNYVKQILAWYGKSLHPVPANLASPPATRQKT